MRVTFDLREQGVRFFPTLPSTFDNRVYLFIEQHGLYQISDRTNTPTADSSDCSSEIFVQLSLSIRLIQLK